MKLALHISFNHYSWRQEEVIPEKTLRLSYFWKRSRFVKPTKNRLANPICTRSSLPVLHLLSNTVTNQSLLTFSNKTRLKIKVSDYEKFWPFFVTTSLLKPSVLWFTKWASAQLNFLQVLLMASALRPLFSLSLGKRGVKLQRSSLFLKSFLSLKL